MRIFIICLVLIGLNSCDYREYPQEEQWKDNLKDQYRKGEDK